MRSIFANFLDFFEILDRHVSGDLNRPRVDWTSGGAGSAALKSPCASDEEQAAHRRHDDSDNIANVSNGVIASIIDDECFVFSGPRKLNPEKIGARL